MNRTARYNAPSTSITKLPQQPLVDTIAHEFSEGLHAHLTAEKMQAVVERNRAETAPRACQSHDFCDASMALYEVFLRYGLDPAAEGAMDLYGVLWD
ncbi:hypothetical protein [Simplicispira lacusdiani]|uniref:hypothetical protein n=1 Tax=Simplicispira lacusdiani TaxID=2213010 RepID=UPI000E75AFC6|nr:hypothetical protein [Simplicispira lacusdiani]